VTSWIGRSIAHYKVTAQIGAGGMGEVYRASDSRLGRDVAIKVLPAAFAADHERMARFEREAKLLASLSHSNIASIFGLEELNGARAIVMELVEGPTLADRIAQGALPADEALPLARQIAEALEYAHERGVIHRDLKPANIKITPDGSVKILDFGLAKAFSEDASASGSDLTKSPTLTAASTRLGVILGTAAYMPPEQAKGKTVDRRADVWSFGVVLFEMLAGRQAFAGETVSETLASVMKDEPAFASLPASVPARIRDLIRRCLVKDPKQRLRDMGDARIRIDEELSGAPEQTGGVVTASTGARGGLRGPLVALIGVIAVAAGLVAGYLARKPAPPVLFNVSLMFPEGMALDRDDAPIAIAPDGRSMVLAASLADGPQHLWLRRFDSAETTLIEGTEGGSYPFWSPDGKTLGFFADRKLKRIRAEGGVAQSICDAVDARGGAWGPDGRIVFAPGPLQGLMIVPAGGGEPVELTHLETDGTTHRLPCFLPGGKRVLFVLGSAKQEGRPRIECLELDSGKRTLVLEAETEARYVGNGFLAFLNENNLFLQRFDPSSLELRGEPVALASSVHMNEYRYTGAFDVSGMGPLLYATASQTNDVQPTWYDFDGNELEKVGVSSPVVWGRISPDGRRLVTSELSGSYDLWVLDFQTRVRSQLTTGIVASFPVWSADGATLYFSNGAGEIFELQPDGGGEPRLVLTTPNRSSWPAVEMRDGTLLFFQQNPTTGVDLFVLEKGSKEPKPVLASPGNESEPSLSPDGRWLAIYNDASGRDEVFVHSCPSFSSRWQISSQGGASPLWAPDGRSLYYRTLDNRLMRVDVDGSGERLVVGAEHEVFGGKSLPGNYRISQDGKRLLVFVSESSEEKLQLHLMTDWRVKFAAAGK